MHCFPLNSVLSDVIEKLKDADVSKIFSAPVTEDEAPGYSVLDNWKNVRFLAWKFFFSWILFFFKFRCLS